MKRSEANEESRDYLTYTIEAIKVACTLPNNSIHSGHVLLCDQEITLSGLVARALVLPDSKSSPAQLFLEAYNINEGYMNSNSTMLCVLTDDTT